MILVAFLAWYDDLETKFLDSLQVGYQCEIVCRRRPACTDEGHHGARGIAGEPSPLRNERGHFKAKANLLGLSASATSVQHMQRVHSEMVRHPSPPAHSWTVVTSASVSETRNWILILFH